MSPPRRQVLVTLIVLLQLTADLVAVPIAYRMKFGDGTGLGLGVLFGLLLGQIALVAAYVAWGRDHWLNRWINSLLLIALLWYAVTVGAVSTGDSFEIGSIEQLLAIVVALAFLFLSGFCWAMRAIAGSRFLSIDDTERSAEPTRLGFRVQDLLTWTAVAAVVLMVLRSRAGRELWGSDWQISGGDWVAISLWMSLWSGLCMLVAVPAMWAGLEVVAYVIVLSTVEWLILGLAMGINLPVVVGLNLGVLLEVVPYGVLFRTHGYRLQLRAQRRSG